MNEFIKNLVDDKRPLEGSTTPILIFTLEQGREFLDSQIISPSLPHSITDLPSIDILRCLTQSSSHPHPVRTCFGPLRPELPVYSQYLHYLKQSSLTKSHTIIVGLSVKSKRRSIISNVSTTVEDKENRTKYGS